MTKSLVIVESPAKAKTINKFLGRNYVVRASMGHVRDLPKSKLGVDVEHGFQPDYVVIPKKKKVLSELKEEAKKATAIYLAPDPDREGEAISFHLAEELQAKNGAVHRVLFNEITKKAVEEAIRNPKRIDRDKVDAQQARRVLDRLVGYQISPLLWEKVRRGLSAGRVQSVALRIVCERERDIQAFQSEEYWSIHADLEAKTPPGFIAKLTRIDGNAAELKDEATTRAIADELSHLDFTVKTVTAKERRRKPVPPFITSKLQQEGARKLGFTAKRTMIVAQRLYEGIELGSEGPVGLITYMRTDSTRIANEALDEARQFVEEKYGRDLLPDKPNIYKSKKGAQDAHEAIRPTSVYRDPDSIAPYLDRDELKLYRLIWNRFVASQMAPALFDETIAEIEAGRYILRARGSVLKFKGFLAVYEEGKDEDTSPKATAEEREEEESREDGKDKKLPPLSEGELLKLLGVQPEQHFTQPPPRFTEASLVKELEEKGIGRPSTYASILSVLQDRQYVQKIERKFVPTELGFLVTDLLMGSFADIMEIEYTAKLEGMLDEIEEGRANYLTTIDGFYQKFSKDLTEAKKHMTNVKAMEIATEEKCDKCGKPMVIKWGRFGHFLACSGYPECRNTREIQNYQDKESADPDAFSEETCEKCDRPMVLKKGRYGQFLACSGYPECKNTRKIFKGKDGSLETKRDQLLDETCPKCGSRLVVKHGRYGEFTACSSYPDCKYIKQKEVGVACPREDCPGQVVERRSRRGKLFFGCSQYPDCDFTSWHKPVAEPCPECGYPVLFEKSTKRDGAHYACTEEGCGYKRSIDGGAPDAVKEPDPEEVAAK
ncbi:MAG TPA: type I DNA topoisomerase [Vicinamibacteria bacterium]|nr:type I DNA topoisomerase [Vicinamibacteria bacterium]